MSDVPSFHNQSNLERTLWVQTELIKRGLSFAEIARRNGWARQTVRGAMHSPSDAQERAIAEAVGLTQQQLFPERFDAQGNRLPRVLKQNSRGRGESHVKSSEAA